MSLDVYLEGEPEHVNCVCTCGNEHTREERERFYDSNVTHNMIEMAKAADVYMCCWRPEEIGITKAVQLIEPLRAGVKKLKGNPREFSKYNPKNGWGDYGGFVRWLEKYLAACIEHPDAKVDVSR